jgi:hypothetical protein
MGLTSLVDVGLTTFIIPRGPWPANFTGGAELSTQIITNADKTWIANRLSRFNPSE